MNAFNNLWYYIIMFVFFAIASWVIGKKYGLSKEKVIYNFLGHYIFMVFGLNVFFIMIEELIEQQISAAEMSTIITNFIVVFSVYIAFVKFFIDYE